VNFAASGPFMKRSLLVFLLLSVFLAGTVTAVFSASGATEGSTSKVTVTDMTGREVEVPGGIDEVVALGPGALRMITYLECLDMVVGVENIEKQKQHQIGRPYLLANPELSDLPSVGPMHGGDSELIVARDPELIFWTYTTAGEANDLQNRTGIPVIAVQYGDLGAHKAIIYEGLRLMGKVLNREERAEDVVEYMEEVISDLGRRTEGVPAVERREAYVGGVLYHGSHGITGTEPKYAPFQFVNVDNPADGLGVEHLMISAEKLIEWDPEIIFVDEGSHSMVMDDLSAPKFRNLTAVKAGKLYGLLPQSYYTHNFSTVLADSYYVGKVLYPRRFSDIDPEDKADEIYEEMVGKPVYDQMKEDFGGFKQLTPRD